MPCDPTTLLAAARCFVSCGSRALDDAQEIVLLCAIRDGDTSVACDPTALVEQARCLLNCVPQGAMQAVKIGLLCEILTNGGGGGGGGIGGVVPLAAGAADGAAVFDTPFAAAPTAVVVSVQDSSDSQVIAATVIAITATGFTFNLSAITETAFCSLHYTAIE